MHGSGWISLAIRESYDGVLREGDNLNVMLIKTPPRRLSSYVYVVFMDIDFVLQIINIPF